MVRRTLAALAVVVALTSGPAWGQGLVDGFKTHVANDWEQIKRTWWDGDWSVYGSGYAWHPAWAYGAVERRKYSDAAWGGGVGRYVYDDDNNYHGLYGLAFLDSNKHPMYMTGYMWQTYWGSGDFKVGLGYTVFLFGRTELDYAPLPGILPVLSLRYSRFEILGAYVGPLAVTKGNVGLIVGRLNF